MCRVLNIQFTQHIIIQHTFRDRSCNHLLCIDEQKRIKFVVIFNRTILKTYSHVIFISNEKLINELRIFCVFVYKICKLKMMHIGGEQNNDKKPCRTCTDFQTWAKQQKSVFKAKSEVSRQTKTNNY